jgi:hypothetical protein
LAQKSLSLRQRDRPLNQLTREREREWLGRARLRRREQCAPFIEAIDRRWEKRNGGMAGDAVAWWEARQAEAELRLRVEREELLAALLKEQDRRSEADLVRFGPRKLKGGHTQVSRTP